MKRIHPAHLVLILVTIGCLLIGYFTAKVNAEENPIAWDLLVSELGGDDPLKVDVNRLAAALRGIAKEKTR